MASSTEQLTCLLPSQANVHSLYRREISVQRFLSYKLQIGRPLKIQKNLQKYHFFFDSLRRKSSKLSRTKTLTGLPTVESPLTVKLIFKVSNLVGEPSVITSLPLIRSNSESFPTTISILKIRKRTFLRICPPFLLQTKHPAGSPPPRHPE
jgi:hypothetical protein